MLLKIDTYVHNFKSTDHNIKQKYKISLIDMLDNKTIKKKYKRIKKEIAIIQFKLYKYFY